VHKVRNPAERDGQQQQIQQVIGEQPQQRPRIGDLWQQPCRSRISFSGKRCESRRYDNMCCAPGVSVAPQDNAFTGDPVEETCGNNACTQPRPALLRSKLLSGVPAAFADYSRTPPMQPLQSGSDNSHTRTQSPRGRAYGPGSLPAPLCQVHAPGTWCGVEGAGASSPAPLWSLGRRASTLCSALCPLCRRAAAFSKCSAETIGSATRCHASRACSGLPPARRQPSDPVRQQTVWAKSQCSLASARA